MFIEYASSIIVNEPCIIITSGIVFKEEIISMYTVNPSQ